MLNLSVESSASLIRLARSERRGRCLPLLLTLGLLSACGGGSDAGSGSSLSTSPDNTSALSSDLSGQLATTLPKRSNVMELTISGLGSNNPQTEVSWVSPDSPLGSGSSNIKATANTFPLLGFLDIAGVATSTLDAGGVRYIATRVKVRNAPACGAPPIGGTCTGFTGIYSFPRFNATFFAVSTPTSINQTAVSRFNRFDGSPANPLLTTSLLPAHGLSPTLLRVDPLAASLQVYNESELPPAEPGVTSVFPYGFVVRNVNDGSRVLPAMPANNQYDGEVTFGFAIPLQPLPTDDPFKISMRFQAADDLNVRVTQSTQEQNYFGDVAATLRATNVNGFDVAVLGGRVAQTPIGNPICRVRTAGTVGAPTAFLVDQIPATPLIRSAPMNLSFVERTSEVSVGFCENMSAPTASTFVVNGSQSGRRVVGGAYAGTLTGGGTSAQPNQLVWKISGQKPYFPGEEVSFTATSGNTTSAGAPIGSFVGSFRIRGSIPSNGLFFPPLAFAVPANPVAVVLGDLNGDGVLDSVTSSNAGSASSTFLTVWLGNAALPTIIGPSGGNFELALGDVNGDGQLDLVTGHAFGDFSGSKLSVRLGNGAGGFGAPSLVTTPGLTSSFVTLGDVNGDGHLDVVVTGTSTNAIYVVLGNGAGGFGAPITTTLSAGGNPGQAALGDLNGDGQLDLVTHRFSDNTVTVLMGNGSGSFGSETIYSAGSSPNSVQLGDVNGDGRLDVLVANMNSNNVSVLIGDGSGAMAAAANFPVGTTPIAAKFGDVNGDGRLDIIATNFASNTVSVLLGNGSGGFGAATNFAAGSGPGRLAIGDVNGDGRLEIVTTNQTTANLSVLTGN